MAILGVDPGTVKSGYALVASDGRILCAGITESAGIAEIARDLLDREPVETIALGRGTNAGATAAALRALGPPIVLIDEYETTRRARELYFIEHPPRGWRRLIPVGLQTPPRPIDDYAAVLIARRFLARENGHRAPMGETPTGKRG